MNSIKTCTEVRMFPKVDAYVKSVFLPYTQKPMLIIKKRTKELRGELSITPTSQIIGSIMMTFFLGIITVMACTTLALIVFVLAM